jgi:hypothetical protein
MMMTMCWILPTGEFVIAPGGGPVTPAFTTGTGQTCAVVLAGAVGVGVAAGVLGVGDAGGAEGLACGDADDTGDVGDDGPAVGLGGFGPTVAPPLHAHGSKKSANKSARRGTSIAASIPADRARGV